MESALRWEISFVRAVFTFTQNCFRQCSCWLTPMPQSGIMLLLLLCCELLAFPEDWKATALMNEISNLFSLSLCFQRKRWTPDVSLLNNFISDCLETPELSIINEERGQPKALVSLSEGSSPTRKDIILLNEQACLFFLCSRGVIVNKAYKLDRDGDYLFNKCRFIFAIDGFWTDHCILQI